MQCSRPASDSCYTVSVILGKPWWPGYNVDIACQGNNQQGDSSQAHWFRSRFNFHLPQKGFCSACQSSKSLGAAFGNRHHCKISFPADTEHASPSIWGHVFVSMWVFWLTVRQSRCCGGISTLSPLLVQIWELSIKCWVGCGYVLCTHERTLTKILPESFMWIEK